MPNIDVVTQAELRAAWDTYNAFGNTVLGIRRRLEDGATVELGTLKAESGGASDPIKEYDGVFDGDGRSFGMFGLDMDLAKSELHAVEALPEPAPEPERSAPELPDWVGYEPLADFRLIAWDSDEKAVEILLTSHEFSVLKERLATMRGYDIPPETWHHITAEAARA